MQFPGDYLSDYFFADFCAGWIRRLDTVDQRRVTRLRDRHQRAPWTSRSARDGALYYLARGAGAVYRVQPTATRRRASPPIPANRTVAPGQTATFTVIATGAAAVHLPVAAQRRATSPGPRVPSATYTLTARSSADNGARFRVNVSQRLRQRRSATRRS